MVDKVSFESLGARYILIVEKGEHDLESNAE